MNEVGMAIGYQPPWDHFRFSVQYDLGFRRRGGDDSPLAHAVYGTMQARY